MRWLCFFCRVAREMNKSLAIIEHNSHCSGAAGDFWPSENENVKKKSVRLTSFVILRWNDEYSHIHSLIILSIIELEGDLWLVAYGWIKIKTSGAYTHSNHWSLSWKSKKKNVVRKVIAFEIWSVQERLIFQDFQLNEKKKAATISFFFNFFNFKWNLTSSLARFTSIYRITIE